MKIKILRSLSSEPQEFEVLPDLEKVSATNNLYKIKKQLKLKRFSKKKTHPSSAENQQTKTNTVSKRKIELTESG